MAGYYVHIPFCRKACRYCDFHFSVSLNYKPAIINAIVGEIELKKQHFGNYTYQTLYFGGGTPSVLLLSEVDKIKQAIFKNYKFNDNFEFTFEANPDDLSLDYLEALKNTGINRLSIGIQSFFDKDLSLMRRSHTADQAEQSIVNSQKAGFQNLNIDLIYGIPGSDAGEWKENLIRMFDLGVPHLSAYHLTYEPGTVFDHWRKKKRLTPVSESESVEQFGILKELAAQNDYIHYETSNFAKEGYYSNHNLAYWNQKPYVGVGPAAHSYDGNKRYWNISHNKKYIQLIKDKNQDYYQDEELSEIDKYNEYILTGLRTRWGINKSAIKKRFGSGFLEYTENIFLKLKPFEYLTVNEDVIKLSEKGILLTDQVIREFIMTDS